MDKFRVIFYPDNKSVDVEKDTTILSAAVSAGVYINSACGGDGVCGRCKVILKSGSVTAPPTGMLSLQEKKRNIYLACLSAVQSDLEVEVPLGSRLGSDGLTPRQIYERVRDVYSEIEEIEPAGPAGRGEVPASAPLTRKVYLELEPPTIDDKLSDLERVCRGLARKDPAVSAQTSLVNIRRLGELLRDSGWKVTAILADRDGVTEVLALEPFDTSARNFGLSFDIGTTTVTGQLVNLNTGDVVATKATYNKQINFGSDVITRIIYAQKEEGLEKLRLAVVECIDQIIREMVREHGVNLNDVTGMVAAGNTTMTHLLLGIDPTHIRREPYVSTANFLPAVRAAEVGVRINPRGLLACVPGVASYVGGDVTSGVLACGLDREDDLSMLIDIGTNGEIVLGNREFLIAAAASAGPAFEGSGVSSGMRAGRGAIQKINISLERRELSYETIGNAAARGICGSGYIDIISRMLETGILAKDGRINDLWQGRVREGESGREFVVVFKGENGASSDVAINEPDIDNLKRAKAAIYSAAASLLRHAGCRFQDLSKIFIAGGFGTCLEIGSAVNIGLLPDLERGRFVFVGNSSLAGARRMLLSKEELRRSAAIARKTTYLELSVEPGYMDEYMAALFFPHTDLDSFPSVKYKA